MYRLATDGEGTLDDQGKQRDDSQHTEETQLFGDHRKQEVGMRFRQVKELLDAGAEADTEEFAAAEGDQRV